jgi:hypothetical protein
MAIALVQKVEDYNQPLGAPFIRNSTVAAVAVGNLLILSLCINKAHATGQVGVSSITDDKGNSYTQVAGSSVDGPDSWGGIWYAPNSISGATTITTTFFNTVGGTIGVVIHFFEFSGFVSLAPYHQGQSLVQTGAPKTPSFSILTDGELLISGARGLAANLTGISAPWTLGLKDSHVNAWTSVYYFPSTGVQQGAFTPTGSQDYISNGANFFSSPAGAWATKQSLSTSRGFSAYVKLPDGKILACGGRTTPGTDTASCEIYDSILDTWTPTGDMTAPQCAGVAILLNNGKVLYTGGQSAGAGILLTAELYDPVAGTWVLTGAPNHPRTCPSLWTLPSGKILMASGMGLGSASSTTAEVYDPATELWTLVTSPPEVHLDACWDSTGDGRAVMIGDFSAGANATLSVYTEAADSWVTYSLPGYPLPQNGEEGNQAIRMADVNILIAGGLSAGGVASAECFIFHQDTNTITQTGSLNIARCGASVYRPVNGHIIVCGGDDMTNIFYSAEEYDPSAGTWALIRGMGYAHSRMAHDHLPMLNNGSAFVAGGESQIGAGGILQVETYAPLVPPSLYLNVRAKVLPNLIVSESARSSLDIRDTIG